MVKVLFFNFLHKMSNERPFVGPIYALTHALSERDLASITKSCTKIWKRI